MAKVVKQEEDKLTDSETVEVTYIKDGNQAKTGEKITVTKEYAILLKEAGYIK